MATRKKYHIGGLCFRSKREIKEHVRSIIARTPAGQLLNGADLQFVRDLLTSHPYVAQKVGPGIKAIRVDLNTHWKPAKMFTILRVDGTETDVSYRACLYPPTARQDFSDACREAVIPDVLEFKEQVFESQADAKWNVKCSLTGCRVDWYSAHVDHAPPWTFRKIVTSFLEVEDLDPASVNLGGHEDGEYQLYFVDDDLRERFRRYHNKRARLRVVTAEANMTAAKYETRLRKEAA